MIGIIPENQNVMCDIPCQAKAVGRMWSTAANGVILVATSFLDEAEKGFRTKQSNGLWNIDCLVVQKTPETQ